MLAEQGIQVSKGRLITAENPTQPDELNYPLIIKPNFEGSDKGIQQASVVRTTEEAILNAMFCSGGMTGREGRQAPPLPAETVQPLLAERRSSQPLAAMKFN